jgi:branched-chain amino acid transport system permease protein
VSDFTAAKTVLPLASNWRQTILPLLLFATLAAAPLGAAFGAQGYLLAILTRVMIFALAAMSLDLILGYGALVSFGHAAFLGIGAYAVGTLSSHGIDEAAV